MFSCFTTLLLFAQIFQAACCDLSEEILAGVVLVSKVLILIKISVHVCIMCLYYSH